MQEAAADEQRLSHLQASRLTPHSHLSLPSFAVNSVALYAAELTSLRMLHCLSSSDRFSFIAAALGVSGVAIFVEGENIS